MGPYVMTLNIINKTKSDLQPLGTAFFSEDGNVQQQPQAVLAQSSGSGGVLEKVGGGDGLFGLVAYSTPDKNKTLIIYTTMPALAGTNNHCWVGLVQAGTKINPVLAASCYDGPPAGFSESKIFWEFTEQNEDFLVTVEPVVTDKKAFQTISTITLNLFKKVVP